jgi:protein-tyrosine phosphatase
LPLTQNSKLKTQNSTTDYHCHILPGIDDGATTVAESIEMARTLRAAGFTTICCTPHLITGVYDNSSAGIKSRVEQLQQQLNAESIQVKLLAGAEYYLDEYLLKLLDDPLPLGDTQQLLVEIPGHAQAEYIKETCFRIKCSGYTPLIAHPERCSLLEPKSTAPGKKSLWGSLFNSKLTTQNSTLLDYLQETGCRFQGNLGSFAGLYGHRVRDKAIEFMRSGLYDCFGSDAHTPERLGEMLRLGQQSVALLATKSGEGSPAAPQQ